MYETMEDAWYTLSKRVEQVVVGSGIVLLVQMKRVSMLDA